ncbi:amino acid adenylation domain-containing protein/non-ribosomal peptide synthase protein (TIGR01720 family) [Paenibacillus polymyxa]|nr:amino acid adenylation domain-containing protein/non-ribosomal peptide synthase protein (TIGR01720 family) [Paenibacillus polymyxa]
MTEVIIIEMGCFTLSEFKTQELYWQQAFDKGEMIDTLPYFKPTPANSSDSTGMRRSVISTSLSSDVSQRVRAIANGSDMALYIILLSGIQCLFHKYAGTETIILGTPSLALENDLFSSYKKVLALKSKTDKQSTFKSLLNQTKQAIRGAIDNQNVPFSKIVQQLDLRYDENNLPIIHTIVSLDQIHTFDFDEAVVFDTAFRFDAGEDLINLKVQYNEKLYDQDFLLQMTENLNYILSVALNDSELEIHRMEIQSGHERSKILGFSGVTSEIPLQMTIHQLFEQQVKETPEQVAVVYENQKITYRKLNERANQLARRLKEEGLEAEQLIGIMTFRSIEMVVAILAVLKAGCAYIPIDPEYPEERIRYTLEDSGTKILLLQQHLLDRISFLGKRINLNDESSYHEDGSNLEVKVSSNDLAYVIYTSGTTGKPKGVMIEHLGPCNVKATFGRALQMNAEDKVVQFASFSFDASIWEILMALFFGATLCIPSKEVILDYRSFEKFIDEHKVTTALLPPAYAAYLNPDHMPAFKKVLTGGSVTPVTLAKRWREKTFHVNAYGPTEDSIIATLWHSYSEPMNYQSIPIGKTIDNHHAYILNQSNQLLPIGVAGELCLSGIGVARGYLNRPELTKEKFVENPFQPGQRMYRTGDLARWLPDGNIDYVGRIDHQVKIRGYRIELGEIEEALLKVESVQEAIVVVREEEEGSKHLCAYFVAERALSLVEMRNDLSKTLPNYMIPAMFHQMEQMPLTPNGKIDRKALPVIKESMGAGTQYVAPRTEVEEILVSIWKTVLGVSKIGVLDNFYDLGGDSIKFIQVSSKLFQEGYQVGMKDLLRHPTIAQLSPYVEPLVTIASQEEVTGELALTPIQQWFFEQKMKHVHHFNQSFMVYREQGFDVFVLRRVIQRIVEHHDVLRSVYRQTEIGYEAWNLGIEEGEFYSLSLIDLRAEANPTAAIEKNANQIQSSIDISQGPLLKLGLFQCADGDHLLLAIHHLVVDMVSWRILFEDLNTGYEQAARGEEIQFPSKTDSYQVWSKQLLEYASSKEMEQEVAYWMEVESAVGLLPKDYQVGNSFIKDSQQISIEWSKQETEQLLKHSNRAYNTEINDLLLTALGMGIHKWMGLQEIKVNVEGHGREQIIPKIDVSRTVGWFTSQYPVLLKLDGDGDVAKQIKRTKEQLRKIPNKGIGYGIMKYLSPFIEEGNFGRKAETSFNYLGQLDQDLQNNGLTLSSYFSGRDFNDDETRLYDLDIIGVVSGGKLMFSINYSVNQYRRETLERFVECLRTSLQEIIAHCTSKENTELTPSDILVKGMTIEELELLEQQSRHIGTIENVYELTPMQKGMYFHSLYDPNSEAYFEQVTFDVRGSLDAGAFVASLEALVQRHAIFKTNFYNGWRNVPLQVVYRNKEVDFIYEDLRGDNDSMKAALIETRMKEDKLRGFNLSQDALLRMTVIRVEEKKYQFIWSFHHILMDGWCIPLFFKELLDQYYASLQQREPVLAVVTPYSDYIEWLQKQDQQEASNYWSDYLAGYDGQTILPQAKAPRNDKGIVAEHLLCNFGKELTQQMQQVASLNQVTVNTLIQTAWGVLLQKYNNSEDVVFGSVVSGRPTEIPGIENMMGLFINTIPVRIRCGAEEPLADVMKRNQEAFIASRPYETYPLYEVQAKMEQKQNLINHIMVFENYPVDQELNQSSQDDTLLEITKLKADEVTNYDLHLIVIPDKEIKINMGYNAKLFDQASVKQIWGHLVQVMEQLVNHPRIGAKEIELLTKEEKDQILHVFNDTQTEYESEKAICQWFEEQAERTPEFIAVIGEYKQLTYRELNRRANQLAWTLKAKGVQKDQPVGIMVERSVDMVIGILAILKAGGAYVPINPEFPQERISYILEDSGANLLLVQEHLQDRIVFAGKPLLLEDESIYSDNDRNLPHVPTDALAYVIYTSGTTGKPKGVMVEHKSVVNILHQLEKKYPMAVTDSYLLKTNYTFDVSVCELFGWFFGQGKLVILENGLEKDPASLVTTIHEQQITHINFVPSMLQAFLAYMDELDESGYERIQALKYLFVAGEALLSKAVKRFKATSLTAKLENIYGPTESTIYASYYSTDGEMEETSSIPIGKPLGNIKMYIIDRADRLQPVGVAGELCIAGEGLARGYVNRPDLTAEKFVHNPFDDGTKMYRTGDLARWLPDGNIEYLGRIDHQVKIRGYRIELGEVEEALLRTEYITETVVIAREDKAGQKQLCAYFVGNVSITVGQLRRELSKELPEYMIPSYYVQLDKMPLSSNGKIDRKALPAPESNMKTGTPYVSPRTPLEKQVAAIIEEVLDISQIGVKDNFFDIGGHSLHATTLVSKFHKQLDVTVSLREVFQFPTIEQLAEIIEGLRKDKHASIPIIEERAYYPVSSAQKRMYILNQLEGGENSYNMSGAMTIEGEIDLTRLEEAFKALIKRHDSLRTGFEIINGEPMQRVHHEVSFDVEYMFANEREAAGLVQQFVRPFDLKQAPLMRIGLIELGRTRYVLLLDIHHIISDGVSIDILLKEFSQLYEGKGLPALTIQYKDYAVWQQSQLQSEQMKQQEVYWLDVFREDITLLDMPTNYARPSVRSYEGEMLTFAFDEQMIHVIKEMEKQTGTTMYMVLFAAYKILLSKYTGQDDIIVGTPVSGRTHSDVQSIVGLFVNTLAIRNKLSADKTFYEFLHEVKENVLRGFENQDYPLEELIQQVAMKKDKNRNALFDTMFSYLNTENSQIQIDSFRMKPFDQEHVTSKFDFTLYVFANQHEVTGGIEYCTKLFKKSSMELMAKHFMSILTVVSQNPYIPIKDIELGEELTASDNSIELIELHL